MDSDKTSSFPSQTVFVARLRKKEIILQGTLAKSVEKTKLQN